MKYELNRIYQGNCMDYMKSIPDRYFELAIVDPPYGIGVNHNMGRRKGNKSSNYKPVEWDNQPPPVEYFNELFRVSNNQVIWGANHFISRMPKDSSCWLMWDKKFSEDVSFAQYELAWTSFKGVCKKFDKDPKDNNRRHPTQKPVSLYKWILKNYAKEGDKILDTHLGSASSVIACIDMGFDFIGIELDEEYLQNAQDRVNQHLLQMDLTRHPKFQNLQV